MVGGGPQPGDGPTRMSPCSAPHSPQVIKVCSVPVPQHGSHLVLNVTCVDSTVDVSWGVPGDGTHAAGVQPQGLEGGVGGGSPWLPPLHDASSPCSPSVSSASGRC